MQHEMQHAIKKNRSLCDSLKWSFGDSNPTAHSLKSAYFRHFEILSHIFLYVNKMLKYAVYILKYEAMQHDMQHETNPTQNSLSGAFHYNLSADFVCFPTMPSTTSFLSIWNCFTASRVLSPKIPSTFRLAP